MSLKEERMQILTMLQEGKITAEEAAKLLSAVEAGAKTENTALQPGSTGQKARWLRIRVTDETGGKEKVSVNLPIGLLNAGLINAGVKIGARFVPELQDIETEEINEAIEAFKNGISGKIVEVHDEDGEHVEIFVE